MSSFGSTAGPPACASTTGLSSRPRPLSSGARRSVLPSATSSRGNPIRTPSSSGSIGVSAKRSSTPTRVRVDNGPEPTAEAFVEWCAAQRIAIGYIQPGKPDQNAFIERFNRSFREEVLDAYLFDSLQQVREITEAWLEIYNTERPHDSLGQVPPVAFLSRPDAPVKSTFEVST